MTETEPRTSPALQPLVYAPLPLGPVKAAGWLRRQLAIQANGLTGHLDEFWPDVADSAWIGGQADGWERGPYWLDGLVPLAFLLDDERLLAKAQRWVGYILDHQLDDGWFGDTADRRIAHSGRVDLSHRYDPWPRFVLLKALTQYQEATGDARVIPALTRFLRRLHELFETDQLYLRSWARYRWADLVVSIHWLFDRTGDPWLLDLAATLHEQGFDWRRHVERFPYRDRSLPEERDLSTHVVNNAMGIKAPGVWSRQSGEGADAAGSMAAIAALDAFHGQATGVFSGDEHLAGRNPSQGTELCAVAEYLYSLETLIPVLGEASLADRLERIAYNALPATMGPDMWTHQYVQQVNGPLCAVSEDRIYTSNGPDANIYGLEPHFGCCTANMHQGWPKFAAHLWMRAADGGLAAVAWAPCDLATEVQGVPVRVAVRTDYPFDGRIEVTVTAEGAVRFPLHLRVPAWAEGATLQLDGESTPVAAGQFHALDQEWPGATTFTLDFPMRARLVRRDGGSVCIHRGPLLFALPIGEDWRKIGGEDPHADWEVQPTTPWNYALALLDEAEEFDIPFTSTPLGDCPFSPEGAPVVGTVGGRRVPGWTIERNTAGPVPGSPVVTNEPLEPLRLVPYGCTNLRIAQFPVAAE